MYPPALMSYRLLWAFALFAPLCSGQSTTPVVDLGYARYQGTFTSNMTAFLGIRYAAPPLGSLRWREPQLPETVSDIQNATALGPACLQASWGLAATNPYTGDDGTKADFGELESVDRRAVDANSEDCLFLSVFTPGLLEPENVTELLPVVVWIHGGGYVQGSGNNPGDDLVRDSGYNIVAVTIQYRLGLFGFLAGEAVKDGGALNAGLLDQQFSLQWVQTHISKFGGDPARVTIWGSSAGAGSVLQHVIANDGKTSPSLFRGAITSSTFLPSQYSYDDVIPEQLYNAVADNANCSSSEDALACLRQVDSTSLDDINQALNIAGFFGTFVFVPVVDGTFITQRPIEALRQRQLNTKTLMAVTNTNEGGPFVNASTADTVVVSDYVSELFPRLSPENVEAASLLYSNQGLSAIDQVTAIMNDTIFVCPTYYLLEAFQGHAFKGQYAVPPATHGRDAYYYFPSVQTPDFPNADFVKAFVESFTAFVSSQDPNETYEPTITPEWDPYTFTGVRTEMLFNRTEDGEPLIEEFITSTSYLERCAFWSSVGHEIGQ